MRRIRLWAARVCVSVAMRLLRPDDWAFDRLWWVNDSLEMQLARRPRAPGNPDRHPAGGDHEEH